MTFGITDNGFEIKRLQDISDETKIAWEELFGDEFKLGPKTPEGQIKSIYDERISILWELFQDTYFSQYPRSSSGVQTDRAVSLVGITRDNAIKSRALAGRAFGVFGTVIPGNPTTGSIVSVQGDPNARFIIQTDITIDNPAVTEIQEISFDDDPDSGSFKITFDGQTTAAIAFNASAATITAAMEALSNIGSGNIIATGSITSATGLTLTFSGALVFLPQNQFTITDNLLLIGATPIVVTPSTTIEGTKAFTNLFLLVAETAGPTVANAETLTVIETPITGWEDVTNELDAILGNEQESDAALKAKQIEEVAIAGAATVEAIRADLKQVDNVTEALVFQNNKDIVDSDGRPPHSLDIVVEGGDNDEIADAIFNSAAGGIETIGDITVLLTDTQNFEQIIKYSRPVPINIFVEIDLVVDPAIFPSPTSAGLQQVKDAVLVYGKALIIGQDVVVFGSTPNLSCSFQGILGILDFTIRVGKTVNPTLDDNVVVAPREIPKFDSSRITVSIP